MFKHMSNMCDLHLKMAWEEHQTRMTDDEQRQDVYNSTQKGQGLSDGCIAYDVVGTDRVPRFTSY